MVLCVAGQVTLNTARLLVHTYLKASVLLDVKGCCIHTKTLFCDNKDDRKEDLKGPLQCSGSGTNVTGYLVLTSTTDNNCVIYFP